MSRESRMGVGNKKAALKFPLKRPFILKSLLRELSSYLLHDIVDTADH